MFRFFNSKNRRKRKFGRIQIWLDDICQEEFLPIDNSSFLKNEFKEIGGHGIDEFGFENCIDRGSAPSPLQNQEIRADHFTEYLTNRGFQKCTNIRLERGFSYSYESSSIKVLKHNSINIHFKQRGDFLHSLWISLDLITSVSVFDEIEETLSQIGEAHELMLVNWHQLKMVDLKNRNEIRDYLMEMFK